MRKFANQINNTVAGSFILSLLFTSVGAIAGTRTEATNELRHNALSQNAHSVGQHQNKTFAFIKNEGQITDQNGKQRSDIDYKLNTEGLEIFVGSGAIHYQWQKSNIVATHGNNIRDQFFSNSQQTIETYRLDVVLLGANTKAKVIASDAGNYYENYYYPSCPDGAKAATFGKIIYKDIYPHIDWVLYTKGNKLVYDFIVHDGGNPRDIKLQYQGAKAMNISNGAIITKTDFGTIYEQPPYTYDAVSKQTIRSAFSLKNNVLSFDIAHGHKNIVIDPTLSWATYYGGTDDDRGIKVTTDTAGNVYMAGITSSTNNIATNGAFYNTMQGGYDDGFLVKFDKTGTRLWATYYGGTGNTQRDDFYDVVTDNEGNVYAVGITTCTDGIASPGAYQTQFGGGGALNGPPSDAMLVKFDANGARVWATYYGGVGSDFANAIACDNQDNIYIAGTTDGPNGIATPGAFQVAPSGYSGFLAKFNAGGVRQWGTYFNGTINKIACDNANNIYIAGQATNTQNIATPGSFQETYIGNLIGQQEDAFIAKFDGTGLRLWGTYYGAGGIEGISAIACDEEGNVYAGGIADNDTGLSTPNGFQTSFGGGYQDGFIVKFDGSGVRQWASMYGGAGDVGDDILGIACAGNGDLYISGFSNSTSGIATAGAYQTSPANGNSDLFIACFNKNGQRKWGTYYGGTGYESEQWATYMSYNGGIACYRNNILVTSNTSSTTGIATNGAHQSTLGGGADALLAAFNSNDTFVYIQQPFTDTVLGYNTTLNLHYRVSLPFNSGNVFTAQLSNSSGSFTTPTNIGTVTSNVDGIAGTTCKYTDLFFAPALGMQTKNLPYSAHKYCFISHAALN